MSGSAYRSGGGSGHCRLVMTVHKLTAGDGYTYLTRQVAAQDATERGYDNLGDYYTARGEAPGVWMGRGGAGVPLFPVGEPVTEAQMTALFGEGRHPNAGIIESAAIAAGASKWQIDQASRLGSPFPAHEAANVFRRRSAGAFRDHNLALGLGPDIPVPDEDRARIRTELAAAMFAETFGRPPVDARELSGHLARISRQATTAVAGYDLTFSPVKSVSTLWAIAPRDIAEVIEQAHQDAVADTLTWLEDHAAYTRKGRHGVAQVEIKGLIAAAFTHRDSRAGDPDLHTHVAISNKVQTLDGQWLALDGRLLYRNNVAASERYNTRLEAFLIDRLGVTFTERQAADSSKRRVREIVGVDGDLPARWSSRRAAIEVRRAAMSAQFQADHGRPPTAKEAVALAQQANLETRERKHEPRSYAEQRAAWRAEAITVLGDDTALGSYVRRALARQGAGRERQRVTRRWVAHSADEVLAVVASSRATWQIHHVRAEAERQTRAAGVGLGDLDYAVRRVVTAALSPTRSIELDTREAGDESVAVPEVLRRSDGMSVYTVAGSTLYTSPAIISAEQTILARAARRNGRTVPAATVEMALLESTANGVELNPGQIQLVRELAGSGARVQLALAPAGTGKTTAMRVLARAWVASGGNVIGLAPSAAAAAVLRDEIEETTDTLAKLIHALRTDVAVPDWVPTIGPKSLVVIDEAGMAGTLDLATAVAYVTDRGGSVRLIGDDRQLAAIGAGGVLRDIAHTEGAVTLSQVMRFTHSDTGAPNHAEGAASLALREGDPAALAHYLDHQRIHVGDITTTTNDAYTSWARDRANGKDAIMLAPTRDLVVELNDRARRDRLADQAGSIGREVTLVDGSHASAGDQVITRLNKRTIPISATDWVKNGDRWTVASVTETGSLIARHSRTGRRITLPADYVAEHVSLAYATTVHGAEGITSDVAHTVATGQETRQLLYVALTRGRHENHLYLSTASDGDPHTLITREALLPPTALDILTRILAREDAPISATSGARNLADPAQRLHADADAYYEAITTAATQHLGPDRLTAIDTAADHAIAGVSECDAYPALRAHLALLALDGHDPAQALHEALTNDRRLDDARDAAAVLDWRLRPTQRRGRAAGPLPWLPAIPDALTTDPQWGHFLRHRADQVTTAAAGVAANARAWTPSSAPGWAAGLLDRDRELITDLAVWRTAHDVADTDHRPTGPRQPATADARAQRVLDRRTARALGNPEGATSRWRPVVASLDPRISSDPYWPTLADRLSAADRAGIDVTALVKAIGVERPLPDEQPAAALWWRLSAHLSPAALSASNDSRSDTLRPEWTSLLTDIIGDHAVSRVLADPAWPTLVAAVTHARHDGWTPTQVLTAAHDLLSGGQPDDEPLRPDELATALAWRVSMLTDTTLSTFPSLTQIDDAEPVSTPEDAGGAPCSAPAIVDDDWLAGLIEPNDADDPTSYDPSAATGNMVISDDAALPTGDGFRGDRETSTHDREQVGRERILELNQQAADFFVGHYRDAWAAGYVAERLGSDLVGDDRFTVGYAPDGWTALTEHLRDHGASDAEIVTAGLGAYASTGRVIDRYRDRVMFPIHSGEHIVGWVGRRSPTRDDDDKAGPKYLNTPETEVFTKGRELLGLTEGAAALATGAIPVLVEGPIDAYAVTLAGGGQYVGVAALGTAFTDTHADLLLPYLGDGRPGVIVATDPDRAGQAAADRAFWRLAARGDCPCHLSLPDGRDPAAIFQVDGRAALRHRLVNAGSLATTIIEARIAPYADRLDTVEGAVLATRRAAQVVAALPPNAWAEHLTRTVACTGVSANTALTEVFAAASALSVTPTDPSRRHLTDRLHTTEPAQLSTPSAATVRWAALTEDIVPNLTADPGWASLAASLDRAAATGFDVSGQLRSLADRSPLPAEHVARSLELRLATEWPGSMPPQNRRTRPSSDRPEGEPGYRAAGIDRLRNPHPMSSAVTRPTEAKQVKPIVPPAIKRDENLRRGPTR
jgi:DNA primase catalytic core